MESFADHFSSQSGIYAKYRPHYPTELFQYLGDISSDHQLAWDCATGNGQSAIYLTDHFEKVIATDPSEKQISYAFPHPRISYYVAKAESSGLGDASVDLITVSQALHWFDLKLFYKEVNRVLKPGGVIAAWCYGLPSISPKADPLVKHFHSVTVDEFWQEGNRMVEREYAGLMFPYEEEPSSAFTMNKKMNADDLCGLLRSWSATERFRAAKGYDPVEEFEKEIRLAWPENEYETATWKITLKAGRKKK